MKEFLIRNIKGEELSVEIKPKLIEFENEESILLSFMDLKDRREAEYAQQKVKEAKTLNRSLKLQLEQNRLIQRRLENSQSYSEGIIESSLDMIFTTDVDGRINKLNSSAIKALGLRREEYANMPFESMFEEQSIANNILEELSKNKSFSGEVSMKRKDESLFIAFLSISYLYSTDGTFLGTMGVSRDITDLKAKEIEIKEQASKLNAVIESSSHSFFTVDKGYCVSSFNKQFQDDISARYKYDLRVGDYFFDMLVVEQQEPSLEEIKRFWKEMFDLVFKGENVNFEANRVDTKGNPFFPRCLFKPCSQRKWRNNRNFCYSPRHLQKRRLRK